MIKPEFLKYPDGRYIALTGETAPKIPNVLIGFTGPSASQVAEVAEPVTRLPDEVVDGDDLPDEWKDAFRAVGFEFEVEIEVEEFVSDIDFQIDNLEKQIRLKMLTMQLGRVTRNEQNHQIQIVSVVGFMFLLCLWSCTKFF